AQQREDPEERNACQAKASEPVGERAPEGLRKIYRLDVLLPERHRHWLNPVKDRVLRLPGAGPGIRPHDNLLIVGTAHTFLRFAANLIKRNPRRPVSIQGRQTSTTLALQRADEQRALHPLNGETPGFPSNRPRPPDQPAG